MSRLYCAVTCILLCLFSETFAQTINVKGTVKDQEGSPLPGANVVLKGTTNGTITDIEGGFTITVPPDGVLAISFIGYNTQEVPVINRTEITITLQENKQVLSDVVVIGYGTKEKKDLTTSISSVSAQDIQQMPVVSFDQALQGRAPGVQVIKNTGAPGGGVSIRIRGTGSINGGQEPLYIIDGVQMTNSGTGSFGQPGVDGGTNYAGNEIINGLAGVNMEDIETIDVLKDAAAASIYGSRAANGVVIITTKRGKEGTTRVNFNTYYGIQHLSRRYDLLNSQQFTAMVNEAKIRQGQPIAFREAPEHNTDWQDEIFQTAPMFNSNLSISGGSKATTYLFSVNYFKQDGIVINSGFDRYSFRANFDHKISDRVKLGSSMMVSRSTNQRLRNTGGANFFDAYNGNSTFGPSIIASALVANPALPVQDENGFYTTDTLSTYVNPVAQAISAQLLSNTLLIIGNVYGEIEPVKNLRIRTSWSANLRDENEKFTFAEVPGLPGGGRLQFNNYGEILWATENYATYDITPLTDFKVNLLAGFSIQAFNSRGANVDVTGVTNGAVQDIGAGTRAFPYSTGGGNWGMASYFARTQFSLKGKYLADATLRSDGSSRFGPNNKYGFFPSASVAWRLSDETFMQDVTFLSDVKLRASWGITGNDQIDPFGWRASVRLLNAQYIGYKPAVPIGIINEEYGWESNIMTNFGLSFGILDNRIQFTSDYYIKRSEGLLAGVPLPATTGFGSTTRNVAEIDNRGFELAISAAVVNKGDLKWNSSFNISFNRNEILNTFTGGDIATGNWGYASVARPGFPISFQLYQVDGINPETGAFRIKDLNGDNSINGDDLQIVASPLPKHFGGVNNNITWKNFDLNVFFQWSYGNYLINNTRGEIQNNGKPDLSFIGPNLSAEALGRWTRPGDVATFPIVNYNNTSGFAGPLDINLEDASYIRLKTVALGYNIPRAIVSKYKIQNARVYVSTNNLLTLTRYSGYDPEVNATGGLGGVGSNIGIGYDNGTYPQARTLVVGVNINL